MSFQENVQNWVSLDNELRILSNKVRIIREERSTLGETISSYVESKELQNATIEISDGKLKFQNFKVSQPLTYKLVETCLNDVMDEEQVKKIIKYIKSKREVKMVSDIKRSYSN
mgnify:FL=1|tara:strand:+ start:62 stop:403 length:342 start_codon:yes stop_codon:yes gene_type:complete